MRRLYNIFRLTGQPFDSEVMVAQADQLIMSAIGALEGPQEAVNEYFRERLLEWPVIAEYLEGLAAKAD